MEVARARLADELGADGDRLAEELDPAPIVLDPDRVGPRSPLLAFKLLPPPPPPRGWRTRPG